MVDSGGCSGYEYKFELDRCGHDFKAVKVREDSCRSVNSDDVRVTQDGVTVLVDQLSLEYLQGATVDYAHVRSRNLLRFLLLSLTGINQIWLQSTRKSSGRERLLVRQQLRRQNGLTMQGECGAIARMLNLWSCDSFDYYLVICERCTYAKEHCKIKL